MDMNWLQSLIFGLISGVTEFIPVSGDAHRSLVAFLGGLETETGLMFFIRLGCLAAVIICCRKQLIRFLRERRYASVPKNRRKRGPDPRVMATLRLLRIGSIPVILAFFGYGFLAWIPERFWVLSLVLVFNGVILYLPRRYPTANKDARSLSALDALIMGLFGAVGGAPGCSRIGFLTAAGSLRGGERRFVLDLALLFSIPALLIGSALAGWDFFTLGGANLSQISRYIVSGIIAFLGSCGAIVIMRFMAYKTGFSGFAYYSWGLALFTFAIYLIV